MAKDKRNKILKMYCLTEISLDHVLIFFFSQVLSKRNRKVQYNVHVFDERGKRGKGGCFLSRSYLNRIMQLTKRSRATKKSLRKTPAFVSQVKILPTTRIARNEVVLSKQHRETLPRQRR